MKIGHPSCQRREESAGKQMSKAGVFSSFSFVSKIFNNGRIVHLYQKLQKKIKRSPRGYKGASI
jgi:hypothetical protein